MFTEAYYYVSDNVSSWRDSGCELATPQLKYSATGVWVRDANNFSQLNVSQTYWIGYYTAFAGFQYIGRYHVVLVLKTLAQRLSFIFLVQFIN